MSAISGIVDMIRLILYDILGLFLPGAALLWVFHRSSIPVLHDLADTLFRGQTTTQIAIFVGASYVLGYAVQGVVNTIWPVITRSNKNKTDGKNTGPSEVGMKGVSPAGIQVKEEIQKSELFQALRWQLGEYCQVDSDKLTPNEVQNLAFSISGDRSDNAFRFSFRADLCAGMFVVFVLGSLITAIEVLKKSTGWWLLLIYALISIAFYLRAKFYYNIRGRIIYTIALAVLADLRWTKDQESKKSKESVSKE